MVYTTLQDWCKECRITEKSRTMAVFSEHGKHCNHILNMANIAIALVKKKKKKKTYQTLNDNNTYQATCIHINRWVLTIEVTWNMQLQHLMPCLGHILAISELNIWLNHILQTVNNLLLVSFLHRFSRDLTLPHLKPLPTTPRLFTVRLGVCCYHLSFP